jgi:hypothetical protein
MISFPICCDVVSGWTFCFEEKERTGTPFFYFLKCSVYLLASTSQTFLQYCMYTLISRDLSTYVESYVMFRSVLKFLLDESSKSPTTHSGNKQQHMCWEKRKSNTRHQRDTIPVSYCLIFHENGFH